MLHSASLIITLHQTTPYHTTLTKLTILHSQLHILLPTITPHQTTLTIQHHTTPHHLHTPHHTHHYSLQQLHSFQLIIHYLITTYHYHYHAHTHTPHIPHYIIISQFATTHTHNFTSYEKG
jgi:hypothetical protein